VTEPDVRARATLNLASTWGTLEPQAALSWANSFPESEASARNTALTAIITSWSKKNSKAATAWVDALPDGEQRTVLMQTLNQNPAPANGH